MSELERRQADAVWTQLQQLTQARIATGRCGDSLPTRAVLAFEVAQAQARDAVHLPLDVHAVSAALEAMGLTAKHVRSQAPDRATYLRRPDEGRVLCEQSRAALALAAEPSQPGRTVVVMADGLSAAAIHRHAVPLLRELRSFAEVQMHAEIYIATEARVALGDAIGERLGAAAVLVLIGERPGLSTPDSLGAYLTWEPRIGRTDAERNCVSNIHARGLSYVEAARKLRHLIAGARQLGTTGVQLHDEGEEPERRLSNAEEGAGTEVSMLKEP